MELQFVVFVMFVIVASSSCLCVRLTSNNLSHSFNVLDYGAVGNGKNDESRVCFPSYFFCLMKKKIKL